MQVLVINKEAITINGKICTTAFISETRQLCETEEGNFVWFKDTDKLYRLTEDNYLILLLKLSCLTALIQN